MKKKTRLEKLQDSLPDGYGVVSYSPGGSGTRYRFYEKKPGQQHESYFSVHDLYTAQGLAQAQRYAETLHNGVDSGTYKIVRHFSDGKGNRTIKSGLTLAEAQAHCSKKETSSRTCTSAKCKRLTAARGPWFDGYTEEA